TEFGLTAVFDGGYRRMRWTGRGRRTEIPQMALEAGDLQGAIAATRFGLGARPAEIAQAASDPKGWLIAQIRSEGADQPAGPAPTSAERLNALYAYRDERKEVREAKEAGPDKVSEAQAEAFRAAQKALVVEIGEEFLARAQL